MILLLLHYTPQVGDSLTAGTAVGEVGNSGTTYVPHLHAGDLVLSVT